MVTVETTKNNLHTHLTVSGHFNLISCLVIKSQKKNGNPPKMCNTSALKSSPSFKLKHRKTLKMIASRNSAFTQITEQLSKSLWDPRRVQECAKMFGLNYASSKWVPVQTGASNPVISLNTAPGLSLNPE